MNNPVYINIGVSGHRDLVDEQIPVLEKHVACFFDRLLAAYPDAAPRVVSPLAEGADRLVATVGLSRGFPLWVPLPMPREEYENDFESPESMAEFEQLISRAERCYTLPMVNGGHIAELQNQDQRNKQYEAIGVHLLESCQVLLVLWDGCESYWQGGTADIVHGALGGARNNERFGVSQVRLVYHIPTVRTRYSQNKRSEILLDPIKEYYGSHAGLVDSEKCIEKFLSGMKLVGTKSDFHTGSGNSDADRDQPLP